ncbi:MAG: alginate O-acetyltransferase AlgX-related protein, partial [Rhodospirillaceae bacterium]
ARMRVTTVLDRFGWRPEIDPPLRTYLPDPPPEIAKGLAVTKDVVSRLAALTKRQGARLVVVLLPARFQVDDGDYRRLEDIVERSGKTLERDGATERFKAALAGQNVPVFDALPALRAAARRSDVFMQSTAHFTPFGHEALAGALESDLKASILAERQGR